MTVAEPARTLSHFVGVDVGATSAAAATWQMARRSAHPLPTFDQTPEAITSFLQHLAHIGCAPETTLIVMEATGSYWVTLASTLHAAGYHISVINPAHARFFAKSRGQRAKTDQVDARVLAQFAAERQPPDWTPPPEVYHELRQRLTAREGLRQMRLQVANQQHALQQWPSPVAAVQERLAALIALLDSELAEVTDELAQVLKQGAWQESAALLDSIPGIGPITTAWLLCSTLNFTSSHSADELTAYAGLAPMAHESGTSVWARPSIGHSGNRQLRTALYLATLSAARYNPMIKCFYERLRAAGKPPKVARCAAARKLLQLARAVVLKGQRFDPNYQRKHGDLVASG